MTSEHPDGEALRLDGTLKDASEMVWYADVDDETPIGSTGAASSSSSSNPAPAPSTKRSGVVPAMFVAGARRTTRAHAPSRRITDPNNAESLLGQKRKLNTEQESCRPHQKARADPDAAPSASATSAALPFPEESDNGSSDEFIPNDDNGPATTDTEGNVTTEADTDGDMGVSECSDEESSTAAYETTAAMSAADREGMKLTKSERTEDIRTIFQKDSRTNPHSNKVEKGHWCLICKAKVGTKAGAAFFTGSATTLRNHIGRHKDHFEAYQRRCERKNISLHSRVVAVAEERGFSNTGIGRQSTLDDHGITQEPRIPSFSSEGLLDYVIQLIVMEDEAFQLIDKGPFRRMLRFVRPSLTEKDLPHRNTLRKEIVARAIKVVERVKEKLERIPGKVSFTFDSWTSEPGDPFLSITGHYIDAPADNPLAWELREEQLAFEPIEGDHSGANMAKIIVRTVDRYNLRSKIGWFTADNATNNDSALRFVAKEVDPSGLKWDPVQHRVRCMEHALHLSVGHLVKELGLKPSTTSQDDSGQDGDADDEDLPGSDIAHALNKALGLTKQIRMSPQARAFLESTCKQVGIQPLALKLWIRTRWASLHAFLCRFIALRKGVDQFVRLADDSDEVPDLSRGREYSSFRLSRRDWENLELLQEVIQEPATAQQSFSDSKQPTVFRVIPVLEFLQESWENMAAASKFAGLRAAIENGLVNIRKWYRKVDDSDVYFICIALDPGLKLAYAQEKWEASYYKEGLARLEEIFDEYHRDLPQSSSTSHRSNAAPDSAAMQPTAHRGYGHSWMYAAVISRQQLAAAARDPRSELKAYLEAPLEPVENVVAWWGQHSIQYPTLARIARDYLAIQGSATPSERAFSSGGLTGTFLRNRLNCKTFEHLQLLKAGYRNGHIDASLDAEQHYQETVLDLSDAEANV